MKQTPEIGTVYEITRARNILVGVWTGAVWIGVRTKWGSRFLDACELPDYVEFGQKLGQIPSSIPLRTDLESFDRRTGRACAFKHGFLSLYQEGLLQVIAGHTSMDEIKCLAYTAA